MVGSALTLSLLLGAVNALPAKPVEERQFGIGPPPPTGGGGSIGWGDIPLCKPGIPIEDQVPCISTSPFPWGDDPKTPPPPPTIAIPPKLKERQILIGPPSGGGIEFGGGIPKCKEGIPLAEQSPCIISDPITGGFLPPLKPPRSVEERDVTTQACTAREQKLLDSYIDLIKRINDPVTKTHLAFLAANILKSCPGIKISDEYATIIRISPRDVSFVPANPAQIASILKSYNSLVDSLKGKQPSNAVLLTILHHADLLKANGVTVTRHLPYITGTLPGGGTIVLIPRQSLAPRCSPAEVSALQGALISLIIAHGGPLQAPPNIRGLQIVIINSLYSCGSKVGDWLALPPGTYPGGEIIPETPVPGGPLIPQPTVPGGPLIPEKPKSGGVVVPETPVPGGTLEPQPTVPGGPIKPAPKKRTVKISPEVPGWPPVFGEPIVGGIKPSP